MPKGCWKECFPFVSGTIIRRLSCLRMRAVKQRRHRNLLRPRCLHILPRASRRMHHSSILVHR
jgi:hypothetical protein